MATARLPSTLILGLALELWQALFELVWVLSRFDGGSDSIDRIQAITQGAGVGGSVLVAVGVFELSTRLAGRGRIAARTAAIAFAVLVVQDLAYRCLPLLGEEWFRSWPADAIGWLRLATFATAAIALTVAADAWRAAPRLTLAIGAVLVLVLGDAVPYVGELVREHVTKLEHLVALYSLRWIVWIGIATGLAHRLAGHAMGEGLDEEGCATAWRATGYALLVTACLQLALTASGPNVAPGIAITLAGTVAGMLALVAGAGRARFAMLFGALLVIGCAAQGLEAHLGVGSFLGSPDTGTFARPVLSMVGLYCLARAVVDAGRGASSRLALVLGCAIVLTLFAAVMALGAPAPAFVFRVGQGVLSTGGLALVGSLCFAAARAAQDRAVPRARVVAGT
jgi:hypothetical protein